MTLSKKLQSIKRRKGKQKRKEKEGNKEEKAGEQEVILRTNTGFSVTGGMTGNDVISQSRI
jgi:hypothetical protein